MSAATFANRVQFQTSTLNSNTSVGVIPNGTAVVAQFQAFGSSDPDNASRATLGTTATTVRFDSSRKGTGVTLPFEISMEGFQKLRIEIDGTTTLGGLSTAPALSIIPVAGQNRWVTITGSNGVNPTIGTSAGDLQFAPVGENVTVDGGAAARYIRAAANTWRP